MLKLIQAIATPTKMNNLFLLVMLVLALGTGYAQKKDLVKKTIIDMHLHALWWGQGEMIGAIAFSNLVNRLKIGFFP
ncbi:MAG TPA: hypothetical protein VIU12_24735 [Chryseolinea sp.]